MTTTTQQLGGSGNMLPQKTFRIRCFWAHFWTSAIAISIGPDSSFCLWKGCDLLSQALQVIKASAASDIRSLCCMWWKLACAPILPNLLNIVRTYITLTPQCRITVLMHTCRPGNFSPWFKERGKDPVNSNWIPHSGSSGLGPRLSENFLDWEWDSRNSVSPRSPPFCVISARGISSLDGSCGSIEHYNKGHLCLCLAKLKRSSFRIQDGGPYSRRTQIVRLHALVEFEHMFPSLCVHIYLSLPGHLSWNFDFDIWVERPNNFLCCARFPEIVVYVTNYSVFCLPAIASWKVLCPDLV